MQMLHDMPPQQQLELCSMINKTFTKQPVVISQNTTQNNMGQRVFQIDENEDVYIAADLEMIYMSEVQDHNNIIIDTGSAYNLIGHHLVPILKQRIDSAGSEMSVIPTKKTFQFGSRTVANSSNKLLLQFL